MDSKQYCHMLKKHLLSFGRDTMLENYFYQQNNDLVYTSKVTKKWLKAHNIDVLEKPSKSPNLNLVETYGAFMCVMFMAMGGVSL